MPTLSKLLTGDRVVVDLIRLLENRSDGLLGRGRGRKVRINTVVERELHAQAGILFQHVFPHLGRVFGFAHIDIPVGDVFLHESDCRGVMLWDPLESTCRHASLSIL